MLGKSFGGFFLYLLLLVKHRVSNTLLGLLLKVKEKSKRGCNNDNGENNDVFFYIRLMGTKAFSIEVLPNFGE
jgi:hypothetical protein